jgi:hypothetical protein
MVLITKTKRGLEVVTGYMHTTIVQLHCDKEVWIVRGSNLRGGGGMAVRAEVDETKTGA